MGDISQFTGDAEQRVYRARPHKAWVNQSDRDAHGVIIRDRRFEVSFADLMVHLS